MIRKEPPVEGPKLSPLCRTIKRDGWELEICIFEDGEGKWLLEVINDVNTSTCWSEPFDTDQEALDEALKTIEENGIEEFHVSQPWREH
jgi:hypothetical protein